MKAEYDVEDLSRRSGLPVDTIRYYQRLRLLHPPRRQGRRARYDDSHLERLGRIRALADRGFSLVAIGGMLAGEAAQERDERLEAALVREASAPRYSAEDLARRLDLPRTLLGALERAGLVDNEVASEPDRRYSESDLEVARRAVKLLRYGFPLSRLLSLAVRHDRAVRKVVEEAIDLFDEYVRKGGLAESGDPEAVAEAFRELFPVATLLVAHHFQRVLINRALRRLKESGSKRELEVAQRETARARLGLRWS